MKDVREKKERNGEHDTQGIKLFTANMAYKQALTDLHVSSRVPQTSVGSLAVYTQW